MVLARERIHPRIAVTAKSRMAPNQKARKSGAARS